MDLLDLNVDNYTLDDLLQLFNIDHYELSEADMKAAKRKVLLAHPDKSQLAPDYFLFFSAAYKMLYSIYSFQGGNVSNKDITFTTEYNTVLGKSEAHQALDEERIKNDFIHKHKSAREFNRDFNDLFEKHKLNDSARDEGYGEFMQSDEGISSKTCSTMKEMESCIDERKNALRALVKVQQVEEMYSTNGCGGTLLGENGSGAVGGYSSGVFSHTLPYEDLRKAHTETVVPVSHADYLKRTQYKSVDELRRDPLYKETTPVSLGQAKTQLLERQKVQTQSDVQRAFALAKQEEAARKANADWMATFKSLCL